MPGPEIDHDLEAAVRQHFLAKRCKLAFDFPEFPDDVCEVGVRDCDAQPPASRRSFECEISNGARHEGIMLQAPKFSPAGTYPERFVYASRKTMSSTSPGADRPACAIRLRRRRSFPEATLNTRARMVVRVACAVSVA